MGLVIDSSQIIDAERRGADLRAVIDAPGELPFLASITVSEIAVGALLADTEQRRTQRMQLLTDLLAAIPVLPFGTTEARTHAELRVNLRLRGTPIGAMDLLIAATALANGHGVLTRNASEFRQVPGLRVVVLDQLRP